MHALTAAVQVELCEPPAGASIRSLQVFCSPSSTATH
jgi:hypothetical protein